LAAAFGDGQELLDLLKHNFLGRSFAAKARCVLFMTSPDLACITECCEGSISRHVSVLNICRQQDTHILAVFLRNLMQLLLKFFHVKVRLQILGLSHLALVLIKRSLLV